MVKLGQKVCDRITGFVGIVTGRTEYISGCTQVLVVPQVKQDGSYSEGQWFDEQRVGVVVARPVVLDNAKTPGPDAPAPKR